MTKAQMIQLTAASPLHIHPAMTGFKALFDAGELVVLPGIGYPTPNYSHFRSMDIWAEADPSAALVRTGWIADYFNKAYTGTDPIHAIDIESSLNRVFIGHPVPVFTSPSTFSYRVDPQVYIGDSAIELALLESNAKVLRPTANPNLKFLADAIAKVPADQVLIQQTGASYTPRATYPSATAQDQNLSRLLQLVARYITGGLTTPVYWTSIGGFDLHANEVDAATSTTGAQANLLGAIAGCIKAFIDDLKAWSAADDVIVIVHSEFGRRIGENGNLGTDHGHGGVAYIAGKPIKNGGIKSAYPDWAPFTAPFNSKNFLHTLDLRSFYATLLKEYWGADAKLVLGQDWPTLGIF